MWKIVKAIYLTWKHLLVFQLFLIPAHGLYDPNLEIELSQTVSPKISVSFPNEVQFYMNAIQGGYPLLGLDVTVQLERPDKDEPFILRQLDDGRLADTTLNDGTYSAKFLDYTQGGRYNYVFHVKGRGWVRETDVNATIETPYLKRMPDDISRTISGSGFDLLGADSIDVENELDSRFPPLQIMDFKIIGVSQRFGYIILMWTSVGGNMGSRTTKVAKYEVRMGRNVKNIWGKWPNETTYSIENEEEIMPAGEIQILKIQAASDENDEVETFTFAMTAFDSAGKKSKESNPPLSCGYGQALDIFFIYIDDLQISRIEQITPDEARLNVTWSVQVMDLIEFQRQNETMIVFEILIGKSKWPMYTALADLRFKVPINVSETTFNDTIMESMSNWTLHKTIGVPNPIDSKSQEWYIGIRGLAETFRFYPLLSGLKKFTVKRESSTTQSPVTTSSFSTNATKLTTAAITTITTTSPTNPSIDLITWMFISSAILLVIIILSLIFLSLKKMTRTKNKVEHSPHFSRFTRIDESKL